LKTCDLSVPGLSIRTARPRCETTFCRQKRGADTGFARKSRALTKNEHASPPKIQTRSENEKAASSIMTGGLSKLRRCQGHRLLAGL
jgi:hypothetical protein